MPLKSCVMLAVGEAESQMESCSGGECLRRRARSWGNDTVGSQIGVCNFCFLSAHSLGSTGQGLDNLKV